VKIERLNPKFYTFMQIDSDCVLQQACDAETAVGHGNVLGPLHGVPISVKSSVEVVGLPCEASTQLLSVTPLMSVGMSASGVSSDSGRSIQVSVYFSGICSLKPTSECIPLTRHFPVSALIRVVGPMVRTVAYLKPLFEVMQGTDDDDSCSVRF